MPLYGVSTVEGNGSFATSFHLDWRMKWPHARFGPEQ